MSILKKLILYWLPVLIWLGLIFYLSSYHKLQAFPGGWRDFISRKFAHFTEYAILCLLFFRGFKNMTGFAKPRLLLLSFLLTVLYALTDEFHQTFVSGRSGKIFDVGVDSLGAFFGLLFCWKIILYLPEEIKKRLNI